MGGGEGLYECDIGAEMWWWEGIRQPPFKGTCDLDSRDPEDRASEWARGTECWNEVRDFGINQILWCHGKEFEFLWMRRKANGRIEAEEWHKLVHMFTGWAWLLCRNGMAMRQSGSRDPREEAVPGLRPVMWLSGGEETEWSWFGMYFEDRPNKTCYSMGGVRASNMTTDFDSRMILPFTEWRREDLRNRCGIKRCDFWTFTSESPWNAQVDMSSTKIYTCLARWFGQLEHYPIHWKAGSIPGQGAYRGFRFNPQSGHIWEATDGCFSPI